MERAARLIAIASCTAFAHWHAHCHCHVVGQEEWADCQLSFANFKSRGPIALQGGQTGELMEKLEEAQMNLGSMMASRYIGPFKEEASNWVMKLSSCADMMEQWVQVQAMWMYLEAVFTSGDIAKQMPQEAKRFQGKQPTELNP